jgi:hypothetical protein
MIHHTQACTLAAILFLALLLPGCGSDNSKEAKITGTVDTTTKLSDMEAKKGNGGRGAMAPGSRPQGYPAPGGR